MAICPQMWGHPSELHYPEVVHYSRGRATRTKPSPVILVPGGWILVVDEYESDAELIRRILLAEGRSEEVRRCATAREALSLPGLFEAPPRLVLLDGHLRGISSLELVKTLRSAQRTRPVPIVVLSDDERQSTVAAATIAGANSYVCKIFDYEAMTEALRLTLRYWLDIHCQPDPEGAK